MSHSSDDDNDGSAESDGEYDSDDDSCVDMWVEDNVDTPDGVKLNGDGDMEREGDDEEEEGK